MVAGRFIHFHMFYFYRKIILIILPSVNFEDVN